MNIMAKINLFYLIIITYFTLLAAGQEEMTNFCYARSKTCDDFKQCCDSVCPMGATAICPHVDSANAPKATQRRADGGMGFMAGGVPEEAPGTTAAGGIPGLKISDTHCICSIGSRPVVAMTMTCLSALDAPDRCTRFEDCCIAACSKNDAHAYLCGQGPDGEPTQETECVCFNEVPGVPGFEELKRKEGADDATGNKVEFEEHGDECFNASSTCDMFQECCLQVCQKVEYSGALQPAKMCVANKNEIPMKSSHTFCRCPKSKPASAIAGWGEGGRGDVSQIFKGASEGEDYDCDVGANVVALRLLIYAFSGFCFLVTLLIAG